MTATEHRQQSVSSTRFTAPPSKRLWNRFARVSKMPRPSSQASTTAPKVSTVGRGMRKMSRARSGISRSHHRQIMEMARMAVQAV